MLPPLYTEVKCSAQLVIYTTSVLGIGNVGVQTLNLINGSNKLKYYVILQRAFENVRLIVCLSVTCQSIKMKLSFYVSFIKKKSNLGT